MLSRAESHFVVGYGGTVNIPTMQIILTEINVIGSLVGTYNEVAELMNLAARGLVRLVTATYPLTALNDAMRDLDEGRVRGRGILVP